MNEEDAENVEGWKLVRKEPLKRKTNNNNITITGLDIIHRCVFYLKLNSTP
jgi:hypothetical protein